MIAIIILRRVSSRCGGCDMGAGSFAAQNTRSPCSPPEATRSSIAARRDGEVSTSARPSIASPM